MSISFSEARRFPFSSYNSSYTTTMQPSYGVASNESNTTSCFSDSEPAVNFLLFCNTLPPIFTRSPFVNDAASVEVATLGDTTAIVPRSSYLLPLVSPSISTWSVISVSLVACIRLVSVLVANAFVFMDITLNVCEPSSFSMSA